MKCYWKIRINTETDPGYCWNPVEASAGNSFVSSALFQSAFLLLNHTLEFEGSSMSYNLNFASEEAKC